VTGFDYTRVDFDTFGKRVKGTTSFERVGECIVIMRGRIREHFIAEVEERVAMIV
jgi:hypothetical protein